MSARARTSVRTPSSAVIGGGGTWRSLAATAPAPAPAAATAAAPTASCSVVVGGNSFSRLRDPLGTNLYEDYVRDSFYDLLASMAQRTEVAASDWTRLNERARTLAYEVLDRNEPIEDMDPDGFYTVLAKQVAAYQNLLSRIQRNAAGLRFNVQTVTMGQFELLKEETLFNTEVLQIHENSLRQNERYMLEWASTVMDGVTALVPDLFEGGEVGKHEERLRERARASGPAQETASEMLTVGLDSVLGILTKSIGVLLLRKDLMFQWAKDTLSNVTREGIIGQHDKQALVRAGESLGVVTTEEGAGLILDYIHELETKIELEEKLAVVADSYFDPGSTYKLFVLMEQWHDGMVGGDDALQRSSALGFLRWLFSQDLALSGPTADELEAMVDRMKERKDCLLYTSDAADE